jgi:predicted metal-dependent phosphoesterase TrpH
MSGPHGWSPAPARGGANPRGGAWGTADMHVHSLYSDGTARVAEILDHVEHHTRLDVVAISDHERIDGAQRARELHAAGGYSYDLVIGEEITTRSGHLLALFVEERIRPLRRLEDSLREVHAQGGLAIAAHPMSPLTPSVGRRSLLRVLADGREGVHFDAIEIFNPSGAGWSRNRQRRALNAGTLRLPELGNSDAHILDAIGSAYTRFEGHTADDYRRAVLAGRIEPHGEYWSLWHNVTVYPLQLVAKLRHLRHTVLPSGEWR